MAMVNDVCTVIWKEWKELIGRSSQSRSDSIKTCAVLGVILVLMAWRGSLVVNNPGTLLFPAFIVVQLLGGLMADSFAGERERHTLETLLSSRLSDQAILVGKILAGVFLAWGLMILVLGVGFGGAYLQGAFRLQLPLRDLIAIVVIYFLLCLVMSCAATLVSLRARTVRQAMQTLTWSIMILFLLGIFGLSRLPAAWRIALAKVFAGENLLRTEAVISFVLAALAIVLFSAARLRFQRARLVLL
jgi:ABC-2 type transport system permease protein